MPVLSVFRPILVSISQKPCSRNGVDSKKGSEYDQGYAMTSAQGGTKLVRTLYPEKMGAYFRTL